MALKELRGVPSEVVDHLLVTARALVPRGLLAKGEKAPRHLEHL